MRIFLRKEHGVYALLGPHMRLHTEVSLRLPMAIEDTHTGEVFTVTNGTFYPETDELRIHTMQRGVVGGEEDTDA